MPLTSHAFDWVCALVRRESAIVLQKGKEYLVESRLVPLARAAGAQWQVNENLRRMVTFQHVNLAMPFRGVGQFDVVFLRNVLIYFDVQTERDGSRAMRKIIAGSLRKRGFEIVEAGDGEEALEALGRGPCPTSPRSTGTCRSWTASPSSRRSARTAGTAR